MNKAESTHRTYTIGDLASEFNVTTRTIRFYEEKGLLDPRREGSRRVYSPSDRTRLRLILRGKRLGFMSGKLMLTMPADDDRSNRLGCKQVPTLILEGLDRP